MSIPAAKGVEIGNGFAAACLRGSANNDELVNEGGKIKTKTNRAGESLAASLTVKILLFVVPLSQHRVSPKSRLLSVPMARIEKLKF